MFSSRAAAILLAVFASTLCGDAASELPQFEVASIKPTDITGEIKVDVRVYPGGRVKITGYELRGLIYLAFQPWKVSGGADWIQETKYEIEAVAPAAMQASIRDFRGPGIADPRLREMLQALLISRFGLRFHRETVTGTVYLLEKGGTPPAFHLATVDPATRPHGWRAVTRQGGQWVLQGAAISDLTKWLSGSLQSPVLDITG